MGFDGGGAGAAKEGADRLHGRSDLWRDFSDSHVAAWRDQDSVPGEREEDNNLGLARFFTMILVLNFDTWCN